jgi:CarD family transcriptional regulator
MHNDRNQVYSGIVKTGNRKEIAKIVNTMMRKKLETERNGKKFYEKDNKLLTITQNILFTELAVSLNTNFEKIQQKITRLINKNEH